MGFSRLQSMTLSSRDCRCWQIACSAMNGASSGLQVFVTSRAVEAAIKILATCHRVYALLRKRQEWRDDRLPPLTEEQKAEYKLVRC